MRAHALAARTPAASGRTTKAICLWSGKLLVVLTSDFKDFAEVGDVGSSGEIDGALPSEVLLSPPSQQGWATTAGKALVDDDWMLLCQSVRHLRREVLDDAANLHRWSKQQV